MQEEKVWFKSWPAEVWALSAKTGEPIWTLALPTYKRTMQMGDAEFVYRNMLWHGNATLCWPVPYGSGAVDASGIMYFGYQDGFVHAVKDENGDNRIDPEREVSSKDVGCAFNGAGVALAPGMLAIASCDGLHVFRS